MFLPAATISAATDQWEKRYFIAICQRVTEGAFSTVNID